MFRRISRLLTAVALSSLVATPAVHAQERERLGHGRLLSNDYFGDGKDRWRTGSWTSSRVWGPAWSGQAPARFGDLIELRLSSEIFAPDNLTRASPSDRPYAGALSVGAHTHFRWKGFDTALGADLVMTGANTGLGSFQRAIHKVLGVRLPSGVTLGNQIPNGFHPTVVGEIGRNLALSQRVNLRPFMEGRAGAETLVRAGFDLTFGTIGAGELHVRESATGQRYRVISNEEATGFSFLLGADMAHVSDSIYLPADRGIALTDSRDRVRAGVQWQGEQASAFYGLTYLGEEFDAQTEGQLLGSSRNNLSF